MPSRRLCNGSCNPAGVLFVVATFFYSAGKPLSGARHRSDCTPVRWPGVQIVASIHRARWDCRQTDLLSSEVPATSAAGRQADATELRYNCCAMQKRSDLMPIYWKFKLKRSYKPHLSVQLVGQMGTGTKTLCGARIFGIQGSARTILSLEGDECARCAEKMS